MSSAESGSNVVGVLPAVDSSSTLNSDADQSTRGVLPAAIAVPDNKNTPMPVVKAHSSKPSSFKENLLKYGSFIILVVNHTGFTMMLRASKTAAGPRYISSTAVAMMELTKLIVSVLMVLMTNGPLRGARVIQQGLCEHSSFILILSVPSFLYVIQNNLLYIALDNLDAVVYLLCKQLKLLSTAFLSVLMLKKKLRWQQWLALVLLTGGVGLVQLSKSNPSKSDDPDNAVVGLLAVLACVMLSGYSGVYFEKVLKKGNHDKAPDSRGADGLWMRNIQMSCSSVPIAFASAFAYDTTQIRGDGFFHGWTSLVAGVVLLQAIGGLLNSVVVNYLDNIIKGFASSYCILTTLILEIWIYNFEPNSMFLLGAGLVIAASLIYGRFGRKKKPKATATPVVLPTAAPGKGEDMKTPLL